ncbi:YcaO-type kinase domain-containing protein [Paucidesulfovibrio gracilis DSM 16080]|uniref:YcaO-type kinase domain-containing protein n=1 Tax=Paucidesulfovibrio gracilis DSM 16080 TaxID=1121449 RepID=A0A1T4WR21_9BACT|nr:YcaO-like family protein [Paucidesulfovibrio gracilis]SKA79766.1 YcaO-type kinase domain-containing protein [Paucidesulfovibrio gracilis DSM 16080]
MQYELKLMDTVAGVGCFAALPAPNLSLNQILDHMRAAPYDDFMHRFAVEQLGKLRTRKVEQFLSTVLQDQRKDPVLSALLGEACLSHQRLEKLRPSLDGLDMTMAARNTPGILLRWHLMPQREQHVAWSRHFAANADTHAPLPAPDRAGPDHEGLDLPYDEEELRAVLSWTAAQDIRRRLTDTLPPAQERQPALETALNALRRLQNAGAFATPEMQHKACLSPFARLRHWGFRIVVRNGRNEHSFKGLQTSYGRGMTEEAARASYAMEVAERFSSYASIGKNGIDGLRGNGALVRGTLDDLREQGALDLMALRSEVPYQGQQLHWMAAERVSLHGVEPALVPAQLAYLFCNVDEQNLFGALGSTGLASGNTTEEARLSALCEVLERDADAVHPLNLHHCFRIRTDDPELRTHLDRLEEHGIHVWFQDVTTELGVPCYRSFVTGLRGDVNKGLGCGLSGPRALVSALTETPYPLPGPASAPTPANLPERRVEDLPDLSTGSAAGDLQVLEQTLVANNLSPHYADMTRANLEIPVCRAIVPGLELLNEFDVFSNLCPRLFRNYLLLLKDESSQLSA